MDDYTPTPRCANPACGSPFLPEQNGQKYCSTRCRETARKRRQRFRLRRGRDAGELIVPPGTTVTSDDGGEPDHWADTDPGEELSEFSDYDDPADLAWSDAYKVHQAVEAIEARYKELARPLLATQARNGGVRLPGLVELEQECADKIDAIVKAHQRAQAMSRAARQAPGRAARAQERQDAVQSMASFAADLGRGGRYQAEPPGRATQDVFSFPEQANVFGSDREVYQRSAVARELGQRVYSPDGWV